MRSGVGFGKILAFGGYTVLQKPNKGLVLSIENARIVSHAAPSEQWEIISSYGHWIGKDPRKIPAQLKFVKEAVLVSKSDPHRIRIKETEYFREKYGLGSSAAVVHSVIDALSEGNEKEKFMKAYIAHSKAQGKIGSGFDVASSVYGSIVYERPSKEDGSDHLVEPVPADFFKKLKFWFFGIKEGFTETPFAAKKVIETVKESKEANTLFKQLAELNNEACRSILRKRNHKLWELSSEINRLRKKVGKLAGVPIEPEEFDDIRRKLEDEGYITVLPGAGGYDGLLVIGLRHMRPPKINKKMFKEVSICLREPRLRTRI